MENKLPIDHQALRVVANWMTYDLELPVDRCYQINTVQRYNNHMGMRPIAVSFENEREEAVTMTLSELDKLGINGGNNAWCRYMAQYRKGMQVQAYDDPCALPVPRPDICMVVPYNAHNKEDEVEQTDICMDIYASGGAGGLKRMIQNPKYMQDFICINCCRVIDERTVRRVFA